VGAGELSHTQSLLRRFLLLTCWRADLRLLLACWRAAVPSTADLLGADLLLPRRHLAGDF
jgi:hypothetical protein